MDVGIEKVSGDLIPIFFQSFEGSNGTVGTTNVEEKFHSEGNELVFVHKVCQSVMPDLIRHPEALENTGFRLPPE
jgi:hypothetical protein